MASFGNLQRPVLIAILFLLANLFLNASETIVDFKIFPQNYELSDLNGPRKPTKINAEWRSFRLPDSRQAYLIKSPGYQTYFLSIDPRKIRKVEIKLERTDSKLKLIGEYPTGPQPKSVAFTPDGKFALVAQLDGKGLDLFSCEPFAWIRQIDIPPIGKHNESGFVEFAMLPWRDEIWVSQMTTGRIRVIGLSDFAYRTSFPTGGEWSKVICLHPDHKRAFVSNWITENISVIDVESHKTIQKIACSGIPRGMAASPDGFYLWVAIFENGNIDKIRLSDGKRIKTMSWSPSGAKRHIVLHPDGKSMYVSDMAAGDIWIIDLISEKVVKRVYIGPKLNTFDISPDGRFLFISSRGNNNPIADYLVKGPDFGTVSVMDTTTMTKVDWIWGRNQPTGLAVNPSGTMLAFTDFLDNNLELYDITAFNEKPVISRTQSSPQVENRIPWFIDQPGIKGN